MGDAFPPRIGDRSLISFEYSAAGFPTQPWVSRPEGAGKRTAFAGTT